MAMNEVQEGRVINHELSGSVSSGDVVIKGDLIGIAQTDGTSGDTVALAIAGVWTLPKNGTNTIDDGEKVMWDADKNAVSTLTAAVGDVEHFGVAVNGGAAAADSTVDVVLCPGVGSYKAA